MKKCFLSAIAGALCMLLIISGIRALTHTVETEPYEQVDYISAISQKECSFCGEQPDALFSQELGDNIAVLDLNTFEFQSLPMNNYDESGQFLPEESGYYKSYNQFGEDTYVHSMTFSFRGYADVEIHSADYFIDINFLQTHLCQDCLDMVNIFYWTEETPPAYAVVNFSERSVRPLDQCCTWFLMENYGIDCDYKENGNIYLRVIYCPPSYN